MPISLCFGCSWLGLNVAEPQALAGSATSFKPIYYVMKYLLYSACDPSFLTVHRVCFKLGLD